MKSYASLLYCCTLRRCGIALKSLLDPQQMPEKDLVTLKTPIIYRNGLNLTLIVDDRYSHVLPVALNDLSNTMASFLGLNDTIQLTSQPFKTTDQPPAFDPLLFTGAIFLGFTYVIMVMGFALELISDREVISTLNTRENSYRSRHN